MTREQPSALSPEDYTDVLREIRARAVNYHGQVGADVDWLLALVSPAAALRAAPALAGSACQVREAAERLSQNVQLGRMRGTDLAALRDTLAAPCPGPLPVEPSEAAWRGHLVALRNLGYNIPQADALAILRAAYTAEQAASSAGPLPSGD